MDKIFVTILIIILFTRIVLGQTIAVDSLRYLGQEPPGLTPKVFAPDIISTNNEYEFGSAFSINADKFYYAVRLNKDWKAEIRYTELHKGKWTKPKTMGLNGKYSFNDPFISQDGNKLYFISNKPLNGQGEAKDIDIWYMLKTDKAWSEPIHAGNTINSEKDEYYISISNTGTLYFVSNIHTSEEDKWDFDIYYSKSEDGEFQAPVRMGNLINSTHFECDPFISPDETYLIFCSTRSGSYGEGDLYISFKDSEDKWTQVVNMGNIINTETHEFCPFVTKDGKYFFYSSNEDIYWVDVQIIEDLRKKYSN